MRIAQWLAVSCLLQALPAATAGALAIASTMDNFVTDGASCSSCQGDNNGAVPYLELGQSNLGVERVLLYFPLNDLPAEVTKQSSIRLELRAIETSVSRRSCESKYDPSSADLPAGCATVHVITSYWTEGNRGLGHDTTAIEGESSWLHSNFPATWSTPGADFDAAPIGIQQPGYTTPDGITVVFEIDEAGCAKLLSHIRNKTYFGLLLKDDDNLGALTLQPRECEEPFCVGGVEDFPPQLIIEEEDGDHDDSEDGEEVQQQQQEEQEQGQEENDSEDGEEGQQQQQEEEEEEQGQEEEEEDNGNPGSSAMSLETFKSAAIVLTSLAFLSQAIW